MTLNAAQLAKKYQMMPGRSNVTYYVLGDDNTFAAGATVTDCELERPLKSEDRNNPQVTVTKNTREHFFWTDKLGGIIPKPGDKFNDGSDDWQVDDAAKEMLGQRWRVTATRGV